MSALSEQIHQYQQSISTEVPNDQGLHPALSPMQRLVALGLTMTAIGWLYHDVFSWMLARWQTKDYSHGYFVPVFALYVLWAKRAELSTVSASPGFGGYRWPIAVGCLSILCGLILRMAGIYTRVLTLEGLSFIPFVLGTVVLLYGLPIARWATTSILFLVFMVPLPSFLANQLSGFLQSVATTVSTYALQTVGVPAAADGNVISMSNGKIGVAEACSGLRMLYAFFALTVGTCLIIHRTWWEKILISSSAIPIAIAVNCMRITATGIAYEIGDAQTAERIFHDFAGWLMMPSGFGLLIGGLWIWDQLLIRPSTPSVRDLP